MVRVDRVSLEALGLVRAIERKHHHEPMVLCRVGSSTTPWLSGSLGPESSSVWPFLVALHSCLFPLAPG